MRFLETRSSGVKARPGKDGVSGAISHTKQRRPDDNPKSEPDDDYNFEEAKGHRNVETKRWTSSQQHHDDVEDQQEGDKLTLVPERLADDLVTGSLLLVEVLGRTVLLDLRIVVLGIAPVLIKSSHLDLLFNGRDIDVGHGMGICQASTERTRECQHCYTSGGGAGSADDDGDDERGVWISELEVL